MALGSAWRLLLLLGWAASTEVLGELLMRPSCETGWFYHDYTCYGYFRKLRTWSDAELECQTFGNGAHLASIVSPKEAHVVAEYIRGYQTNRPVWIGLYKPEKRQRWQWVDGTVPAYSTWSSRSENRNQHCGAMNYHHGFLTWSSSECNKPQHFLCKYRP